MTLTLTTTQRPTPQRTWTRWTGVALLALTVLVVASCGDEHGQEAATTATVAATTAADTGAGTASAATSTPTEAPAETRVVTHTLGESEIPSNPQRVIALGEEWMLADLLSLDIRPIASTASGPTGRFLGGVTTLFDVSGIEPLSNSEPDIERIAALEPDLIITSTFVAESLGDALALLEELAPVVGVQVAGAEFRAEYLALAAVFEKEATAEERLAQYDSAVEEGAAALPEGVSTSVVTVFDASYIRVYVGPGAGATGAIVDLGIVLDPDAETLEPTLSTMRAEISGEQINVLTGDHIILLQSDAFDEADVVESVQALAGWATLPAVQAGQVHTVDRFAHPGLPGRIQAVHDLTALFAE